MVAFVGRKRKE